MDGKLDLKHPTAAFNCRVSGSSKKDAGFFDGDLLIVVRIVEPEHMSVVARSREAKALGIDKMNGCYCISLDGIPPSKKQVYFMQ